MIAQSSSASAVAPPSAVIGAAGSASLRDPANTSVGLGGGQQLLGDARGETGADVKEDLSYSEEKERRNR